MPVCGSCGQSNPDVARFCLACGAELGSKPAPQRRKLATLLFCDMSGSTAMGERVDSEAVREMMFEYFGKMRAVIEAHGGTIEKFVGDAVMAAFGVPLAHEDDALRAVKAAFEMQGRMQSFNIELEKRFGSRIALRIGVNTGEVIAGDARSRETFVTGDAVNVAARLEQAASPGEVLIGESTLRLVATHVEVEPMAPLRAKGKSEPLAAFRLLNVSEAALSQPEQNPPMVGREEELAALREAFTDAVSHRQCHLVTVVGEPGVGKSRLVSGFLAKLHDQVTVLAGRCLSYGDGITFWPVGEIVREAAEITDVETPLQARALIASLLVNEADADSIADTVALSIGLAEGAASADEVSWAVRRFFESLARARPLIVVFDDIHWAEPVLLDTIASLPKLSRGAPILVVCLGRPELLDDRDDLGKVLRLEPLDSLDTEQLIEHFLGGAGISAPVRERLIRAADGNPLFVLELLAMLIEDKQLTLDEGTWSAEEGFQRLSLPPTIDLLLAARLDRLEEEQRAAIERGSIEGQIFHVGAVAELASEGRTDLSNILKTLVDREFLQPATAMFAGEGAYGFRHILMREAAYRATAKRLRAELHERFADWLEVKVGARLSEYEEIIGFHLEQAFRFLEELGPLDERGRMLSSRSAQLLIRAGRRSSARGDLPAAINLLERASSLLPPTSVERAQALLELGAALREMGGQFKRCTDVLGEALQISTMADDETLRFHILIEDSLARLMVAEEGSAERLRVVAEDALAKFATAGDDAGLARAWNGLAYVHLFALQLEQCTGALERALHHAELAGDERLVNDSLPWFGAPLVHGPLPVKEALVRCRELLDTDQRGANARAAYTTAMARLLAMEGDFQGARGFIERARAIAEEFGSLAHWNAISEHAYGVERLAGDPVAAESVSREGYKMLKEAGDLSALSTRAAELAEALYYQGRFAEAGAMVAESAAWGAEEDVFTQVSWRLTKAKLMAQEEEPDGAQKLAREAVDCIRQTDALEFHGDALLGLAEVLHATKSHSQAVPLVDEAIALYEEKGVQVSATRARQLLERLQG
jgi:class 3 adenylate cyclase/tetratricopeptide (TPR) repeat protein